MRVRNLEAVIIAFAVVACTDGTAPKPLTVGAPLAALVDGGNGGNPAFLFLAPLSRPNGGLPGKLDRTVEPVVDICQLSTDRTQCESPVVKFTMADGHGRAERIRLSGNHFSVDWQTRRFNLEPSNVYRICVSIGDGHGLGHVDVAIAKRGRARDDGERDNGEGDFLLHQDRPLAIEFWIGEGAGALDKSADAVCGGGGATVPATISGQVSGPYVGPTVGYTVYLMNLTADTVKAVAVTDSLGTYTFTSSDFVPGTSYLVCEANPSLLFTYIYQELPDVSSGVSCNTFIEDTSVYGEWGYLVTAPASSGVGGFAGLATATAGPDFRNGYPR